jgi:hypothetical protein
MEKNKKKIGGSYGTVGNYQRKAQRQEIQTGRCKQKRN